MSEAPPRIVPGHTESTWRWTWHYNGLAVEVEYVVAAQKWLRATGEKGGGWAPQQRLTGKRWTDPETQEDAEKMVRDYADEYPPRGVL